VLVLALKLTLTPVLIATATLAGRRWGGAVSGWIAALPLTSGPVAAFLVADHGARFGAHSATGSISGVAAEAAFCLGYVWSRRRGWPLALLAATAGFAAVAAVVEALPLSSRLPSPLLPVAAGAVAVLTATLAVLPREAEIAQPVAPPRWDLPLRAIVATALVVLLTEIATRLGARLTGLLAVFPLYVAVLAAFAHRAEGPAAPARLIRGVVVGLFSFVAFFFLLAALLGRIAAPAAFALAAVAACACHVASLRLLRLV